MMWRDGRNPCSTPDFAAKALVYARAHNETSLISTLPLMNGARGMQGKTISCKKSSHDLFLIAFG